jgi:hypothetical protein
MNDRRVHDVFLLSRGCCNGCSSFTSTENDVVSDDVRFADFEEIDDDDNRHHGKRPRYDEEKAKTLEQFDDLQPPPKDFTLILNKDCYVAFLFKNHKKNVVLGIGQLCAAKGSRHSWLLYKLMRPQMPRALLSTSFAVKSIPLAPILVEAIQAVGLKFFQCECICNSHYRHVIMLRFNSISLGNSKGDLYALTQESRVLLKRSCPNLQL